MVLTLLSLAAYSAFAQQKISGTVADTKGQPVIGAGVVAKGTTVGTLTDIDGSYSLSVPEKSVISVSCIGYTDAEATLSSDQKVLNFTLSESSLNLDDVVVIGYQTVKRRDLTGSVASITGKELAAVPVANATQALQGKLPGVQITSQDGRPGASMSVRVRGGGSITQGNDPLYVVDGITVGNINDIPADNIESIDVLKDAASTAIYGARGANGVILVTTKGGRSGRASVTYNMYYQLNEKARTLDVMDAEDYVFWNWAYGSAYGETYGNNVAKYFGLGSKYGNHLAGYGSMTSHNWMNDVLKSANTWNHDVSLSGGNDRTKYFASVNYLNDDGIRINSGYRRFNANFKLSQKIGEKFQADIDLRYGETKLSGTRFNMASSVYSYRPVDKPLGEDDATLFGNGGSAIDADADPVSVINNYENYSYNHKLRGTASLAWNAFNGFTAKSEISISRNFGESDYWDNGTNPYGNAYKTAKLEKSDGKGLRWSNTINYVVPFNNDDHSLSALAGYEVLSSESNSSTIQGAGYPDAFTMDDAFGMISMTDPDHAKDTYFSNSIGTPSHTISYFGRANYAFKGRYLFTATFRADGSSKFAPNHHWGYFPAAAAAWRVSDEPFMASTKSWMDDLKVRLSYGTSGSDNISPSLWKETWKTQDITIDGVIYTGYVPGDMQSNPDLKWETTISRNAGLDFSFLKGAVKGSLEGYWNTTKDILMKVPCDPSSGYSYQFQNVGQTSNKGIELSVNAILVRQRDWGVDLNFTYSFNRNNVDAIYNDALADTHTGWGSSMRVPYYDYIIREGNPVGLVQGFKSLGYYTVDDFDFVDGKYVLKAGIPDFSGVVNYPDATRKLIPEGQTAFPGAAKFEDTDESGTITEDDATIIGKMMPQHTGGFSINANWKSLDFSANFTYQLDGKVYNANAMHSMMGNKDNQLGENRLSYVNDCWQAYDVDSAGDLYLVTDPSELSSLNSGAKYALPYSEYGLCTSDFIESAAYLRLNTLTLGYTLPQSWMDFVKIRSVRVYFTAGNLFCLSSYSGLDPDVNTNTNAGGDGFPTSYYDYQSYPKSRNYTFGLNVRF